MSAEALLWKRVSEVPGVAPRGYLAGALDQGLLCLAGDDSAPGLLSYRAFRPGRAGGSVEPLQEFTVAGLELEPEFERVARVAAIADAPSASDLGPLIGSALPPGTAVVGAVAGSDSAVLYAVRAGQSPELGTVATWWEDAGTLVVLPCRLSVPAACLIPVDGAAVVTAPSRARTPSPQAAVQVVPATEPERRPVAPTRSRALLWGGGVAAVALAAVALWYSGAFAPDTSPVADTQVVRLPDALPAGGGDTTSAKPESTPVSVAESTRSRADTSTVVAGGAPRARDAGKSGAATRPVGGSDPANKGSADPSAKGTPGGTIPLPTAVRDSATVAEPPPPPSDSRADEAELRVLSDQSTTSTELSPTAALAIAVRAEGLFARLREQKNRSDAARVVLRASAIAGGRPEACPFLDRVDGLSAREREYFRSGNRCPGGSP